MKDPAFLFYSKDWLEGTADLFPQEKGVYIDLLCHQHQKGFIPSDMERIARMVGLSAIEFNKIWEKLKHKFQQEDERMVNRTLQRIMSERLEKGNKNRIIGTFASVIRKREMSKKEYQAIRAEFKIEEFSTIPTERLTERLTEWLDVRLKSFAIGNANAIGNEDINTEGVKGEEWKMTEEQQRLWKILEKFISDEAPQLLKFKEPLIPEQYFILRNRFKIEEIEKAMRDLDNYKGAAQKYVSVYKTLSKWIKMARDRAVKI